MIMMIHFLSVIPLLISSLMIYRAHGDNVVFNTTKALSDELQEVVQFLVTWTPPQDVSLSKEYIVDNAELALEAPLKSFFLKDDLFLNDVAPYAVFDEERTEWRKLFYDTLSPLIDIKNDIKTNIEIINDKTWTAFTNGTRIQFIAAEPDKTNNKTPFEVISGKYTNGVPGSSCTGLAIFLVYAFRSVGIPARGAGVPHWNKPQSVCPDGDASPECGNHNWVEVFDGEAWHFVSPLESKLYDNGWFYPNPVDLQVPLSGNHSVYATSWKNTTSDNHDFGLGETIDVPVPYFPLVWSQEQGVNGYDVARRYVQSNYIMRDETETMQIIVN